MTPREKELRARRRRAHNAKKKSPTPRKRLPPLPVPAIINDSQVLSFRDWCGLNGISLRTGREIVASGAGPIITQLSERRIGVTVGNNAVWQASRARA
jgi:hypothetical protein